MAWLVARSTPYGFSTSARGAPWRIVADAKHRGTGDWQRYDRRYSSGETCSFLVDARQRVIAVDAPSASWRDLYTLRMVRNVLRWEFLQQGAVFMHGSCVSIGGRGLCLIGPSRSGKSSLTLSAIRDGGWDFVTDDDATILQEDENLVLLGWPGSVRMRRSTLDRYPEIAAALPSLTHPANALESKLDSDVAMLRVFPEELSTIYGCDIVGEARLAGWGVPGWSSAGAIHSLNGDELAPALEKAWDVLPERRAGAPAPLGDDYDWESRVFDPFLLKYYGVPPVSAYKETIDRWSRTCRGYSLRHTGTMSRSLWGSLMESLSGGAGRRRRRSQAKGASG